MLLEWRLKQIRFKQQKKLNENNLYLYKSITSYVQNSDLRRIDKEDILQQVMDMMLEVQIENKPVNLIIGNDYEEFCKSIIEEYNRGNGRVYSVLNYIQSYLLWMIFIFGFMMIIKIIFKTSIYSGITLGQFIIANITALIIIPASKKNMQETSDIISLKQRVSYIINNSGATKSRSVAALAFMIVIFVILRLGLERILGSDILDYKISLATSIPLLVLVIFLVVAIGIYKKVYSNR